MWGEASNGQLCLESAQSDFHKPAKSKCPFVDSEMIDQRAKGAADRFEVHQDAHRKWTVGRAGGVLG